MKLKRIEHDGELYGWVHWCPGCEEKHVLPANGWSYDGNGDSPTFTPSFNHTWTEGEDRTTRCCHYTLTTGVLQFSDDSTHGLAGKSALLPELPP